MYLVIQSFLKAVMVLKLANKKVMRLVYEKFLNKNIVDDIYDNHFQTDTIGIIINRN